MAQIIQQLVSHVNAVNSLSHFDADTLSSKYFPKPKSKKVQRQTKESLALNQFNMKDLLSGLLDIKIASDIESYIRNLNGIEREVFNYLVFYYRKWAGNIEIPITNILSRFNIKRSWCMEILKRIKDKGLIVATGGGYGRKWAKRTLTERGKIVWKAISQGVKAVKQDIPKNTGHYPGHYQGGTTNYISSEVGISQGSVVINNEELTDEAIFFANEAVRNCREMLKMRI